MRRRHTQNLREIELLTRVQGARQALAFLQADSTRQNVDVMNWLTTELNQAERELERLRTTTSPIAGTLPDSD